MSELGDVLLTNGLAVTMLIFGVWKGIPYIRGIFKEHSDEMRELMDSHEKKLDKKDEFIRQIAQESAENHRAAMKIIEANTQILTTVASEVNELKKKNYQIEKLVDKTNMLIDALSGKMRKVD